MTATPPAGWYPDRSSRPPLASFGQRLAAAILDGLVVAVPTTLVLVGLFGLLALATRILLGGLDGSGGGVSRGLLVGGFAVVALVLVAAISMPLLYGIGFEGSSRGQTIGKWAVGIRVVDGGTACRLAPRRAAIRVLVRSFASGGFFALGYLWMLWDDQGRTWHDLAADSRVVVVDGPRPPLRQLLRTWTLRS